jgi:hypothetical protein
MAENYQGTAFLFTATTAPIPFPSPVGYFIGERFLLPPIGASSRRYYMRGIDWAGNYVEWFSYVPDIDGLDADPSRPRPFQLVKVVDRL